MCPFCWEKHLYKCSATTTPVRVLKVTSKVASGTPKLSHCWKSSKITVLSCLISKFIFIQVDILQGKDHLDCPCLHEFLHRIACVWNERFLNGCTTLMGNVTVHRTISGHLVLHTTGEEITSNKAFQLQDDCSRSLNDCTWHTAVAYMNVPLSHLTMNWTPVAIRVGRLQQSKKLIV